MAGSLRVTGDEGIEVRLKKWAPYTEPASEVIQRVDNEIGKVETNLRGNYAQIETIKKQLGMIDLRETTTTSTQGGREWTEKEILRERDRIRDWTDPLRPRQSTTRNTQERYSESTTIDTKTGLGMIPLMDVDLANLFLDKQSEFSGRLYELVEDRLSLQSKYHQLSDKRRLLLLTNEDWRKTLKVLLSVRKHTPEPARFYLDYFEKGVNWSPIYTFHFKEGSKEVEIDCYADLKQNSGEDWKMVNMDFSFLESFSPGIASFNRNFSYRMTDIPSSEDFNQNLHIASIKLQVEIKYLVAPLFSEYAHQYAQITNTSDAEFMSGPAQIFLNDKYIGSRQIPVVGKKQKFNIGLGTDSEIRTFREVVYDDFIDYLKKNIRLRIENHKDKPIDVVLFDTPSYYGFQYGGEADKFSSAHRHNDTKHRLPFGKQDIYRWNINVPANAIGHSTLKVEYHTKIETIEGMWEGFRRVENKKEIKEFSRIMEKMLGL